VVFTKRGAVSNENPFEPIIDYLKGLGHDVLSIRDAGLSGISELSGLL